MGQTQGHKKWQQTETEDERKPEASSSCKREKGRLTHVTEDMGETQGKGDVLLKRIVDALEMGNVEHHRLWTKLMGVHQALEYSIW